MAATLGNLLRILSPDTRLTERASRKRNQLIRDRSSECQGSRFRSRMSSGSLLKRAVALSHSALSMAGEPDMMTAAEKSVLAARALSGVRLSCQMLCDHDMTVRAISRLAGSGRKDAGNRPLPDIQPPPVWIAK